MQGKGRLIQTMLGIYEGDWRDSKAHGKGRLIKPSMMTNNSDGVVYNGEFSQDRKNGEGIEEWPDGTKYIGLYYNELKNGKGMMIWPDGDR